MFFESSSPLRTEADNWFLKELRGRHDVVLKYVARHPGASHADIVQHARDTSHDESEQVAGYIRVLIQRYGLIDKRLPVFARPRSRGARYYLADNFLRAWLAALASPVSALAFSPVDDLVARADEGLSLVEGGGFEKLVGLLYEERSRKGIGDFALSQRIQGYWDRRGTEIDLVAVDEENRRVRFGECKRSETRLSGAIDELERHVERFLSAHPAYRDYSTEKVMLAPTISPERRSALEDRGVVCEDLNDLTRGLT